MSKNPSDLDLKAARQRVSVLTVILRRVLQAIDRAEEVGCLDHLDCWETADRDWYDPIRAARDEVDE